jgi:hypothetical protein
LDSTIPYFSQSGRQRTGSNQSIHCPKTAASTFGTSHAALNYSLCGGHYNHCVIFGVFCTLSVSASWNTLYMYIGSNIPAYSTYSSDADTDNA